MCLICLDGGNIFTQRRECWRRKEQRQRKQRRGQRSSSLTISSASHIAGRSARRKLDLCLRVEGCFQEDCKNCATCGVCISAVDYVCAEYAIGTGKNVGGIA